VVHHQYTLWNRQLDGTGDDDDLVESGVEHVIQRPPPHRATLQIGQQFVGGTVESATTAGAEKDGDGGHISQSTTPSYMTES
jgi:hypothetical protein